MKKKRILVFPFDIAAHYLRCLMLARALKDDYDILFCHSGKYADLIKMEGFETFKCKSFDPDKVLKNISNFSFDWLNYNDLQEIIQHQAAQVNTLKPFYVIGDNMPTLNIVSELTGCIYISLVNTYMTKYYALQRPVPRNHPSKMYEQKLPVNVYNRIACYAEKYMFKKIHKPFKKIRKEMHLQKVHDYQNELEGSINLLCDSEFIFPVKSLPSSYRIIGPLFYKGDQKENEVIEWLKKRGRKNILVNMGSTGDISALKLLKSKEFDEFSIVIAGETNRIFSENHVYCKLFINNAAILDMIDLVICHGGNGTIYQALSFGIPLLCLPSLFEQEYNIERISTLGLGAEINLYNQEDELIKIIRLWIDKKQKGVFSEIQQNIKFDITIESIKRVFNSC